MILKSIEMQGFKSFPDKTVFELGKGITGVVGPNGSGKSNISDAVRWVLGEQSTKALRGARMEDVIFSGTGVRKALGYSEVTLRLDNKDRMLDKDADEVAVTRRYYRSGESEYKINGEECRLRDIHELFMDTGLGRDGYSMVSQGRIADLVSAKSSQRRDMLEEAAGISHHRYRRADTIRKLEQAEENLVRLRDILAELESRIGPLKTQSEKAVKYLALADEKKSLEIGLWLNTIDKASAGLKEQETKLSVASSQYDFAQGSLEKIQEQIEENVENGGKITVEIERLTRSVSENEEQATYTEGLIAVEKNNIEHNLETIERITADMGDSEKSAAETDEQIEKANADIESKEKEIEEVRAKLAEELENLNVLLGKSGENGEKARKLNEELNAAALRLSDVRVEKTTAQTACDELEARLEIIAGDSGTKRAAIKELETQAAKIRGEISRIQEETDSNNNSLDGYRMIIGSREDKVEALRKELEEINLEIYQKNARIKMLDDLEKNLDGYAGSVQKVIKEAKRGAMRGIRGTLSQLITTSSEYSVAIETALGAAIQNIVTDDENAAKRAVAYLKENRAGRATFLPLTSVRSRPFTEKGLEKCEGYIKMADELVTCDKQYGEIIGSLLGRTAVVDNIDNGIAMAKLYSYRFKIVTLDGQVINAGGSITGGSRGSGVGFLSRISEIDGLKEKVSELQSKLDGRQKVFDEMSGELTRVKSELEASESELIKLQEEMIRAESELNLVTDRQEAAEKLINDMSAEEEKAKQRIAEAKESIKKADKEIDEITSSVDRLNSELSSLDEEKDAIEELREKSAGIREELNINIVSLNKEIEADREIISAAELRREILLNRSDKLVEEIEQIKKNNEETQKRIEEYEAKVTEYREKSKETGLGIEELVAKRDGNTSESVKLRTRERELNEEKEKLGGELARLEERKETLERDLETTRNKLYDEYQLTYREALEVGTIPEDIGKAQRTLQEIRGKIRALGSVNPGAVEEYKEVSERYEYLNGQLTDIETSKKELEKQIIELTEKMAEKFREQFRLINNAFGSTFRDLFDGGRAELVLDDPQDVLECAINIRVQPPGKNVQNIDLLSGGEKGLAAIALLFAILKVNPAPFCILDEVEAALDEVNVAKYASYVRGMTDRTQFILITHRRGTMEESDVLYGVTMQEEGVSKMLKLQSADMAKKLGIE